MLKMTGAVMVFISCWGMGYHRSLEYRKRIRDLLMWKKFLLMLRGEIRYARTTLPEAFRTIGQRLEHAIGYFLLEVADAMEGQQGERMQHLWDAGLNHMQSGCSLSKEDIRSFQRLGGQLGYLDRDMQLSTIDFHVEQLEGLVKTLQEQQGRQSRVCHCLGIFAGVMLNLMLI